jgi:hypothetical protein
MQPEAALLLSSLIRFVECHVTPDVSLKQVQLRRNCALSEVL